jgi:excisionase family DNA binding protein
MQNRASDSKINLLSIEQAAVRLGLSARSVRRLIASRRLRAVNLAESGKKNCIRIKPEWIDALIANSEPPPEPRRVVKDNGNLRVSKYSKIGVTR